MESILEKAVFNIIDQIKVALDGRTQRWLSKKTGIRTTDLSMKMTGKMLFSDEELKAISQVLGVKIKKN